MVVPVLITSCQASEKWKSGPVAAHTRIASSASVNEEAVPVKSAMRREKLWNRASSR